MVFWVVIPIFEEHLQGQLNVMKKMNKRTFVVFYHSAIYINGDCVQCRENSTVKNWRKKLMTDMDCVFKGVISYWKWWIVAANIQRIIFVRP